MVSNNQKLLLYVLQEEQNRNVPHTKTDHIKKSSCIQVEDSTAGLYNVDGRKKTTGCVCWVRGVKNKQLLLHHVG